jgi:hypothetical protein
MSSTPTLAELYHLADELERDRATPVAEATQRDHAIAAQCPANDDVGALRYWLASLARDAADAEQPRGSPWLSEASIAALARLLALFFGISGMAGFLLTSGRGLVNVFMFMLLFVIVQALLCLVGSLVLVRTVAGGPSPVVLPVNPVRLLFSRVLPDRRYMREAQALLRLVFLRYGQELGALFTIGALGACFAVLALSNFTFVWGSTFNLSDSLVEQITAWIAAPWSSWLPTATVSGDLIFASRYHPAVTTLGPADVAAMRGWWPFLVMSMVTYALVPRLLLWLLSWFFYRRQMRAAFLSQPGCERVLARMRAPVVSTRGEGGSESVAPAADASRADRRLLLLNWANALSPEDASRFEDFASVPDGNILNAGLGSLPEELERLAPRFAAPVEHLYVAVRSWEPPMADLADFLAGCARIPRCTLFLVPLPQRPVAAAQLSDWQAFARDLAFGAVAVQVLERG